MHMLEHGSSGDHGADLLFLLRYSQCLGCHLLLPFAAWLDADMLSFLIRKGAHFSIYALLGICVYMALFHAGKAKAAAAWIICALYACSDELHQMMVMGRSAQLSDVALDSLGALCGILFCLWIIAWKRKRDRRA